MADTKGKKKGKVKYALLGFVGVVCILCMFPQIITQAATNLNDMWSDVYDDGVVGTIGDGSLQVKTATATELQVQTKSGTALTTTPNDIPSLLRLSADGNTTGTSSRLYGVILSASVTAPAEVNIYDATSQVAADLAMTITSASGETTIWNAPAGAWIAMATDIYADITGTGAIVHILYGND